MKNLTEEFIESLRSLTSNNLIQWYKVRSYLDREYNRILEHYLVKYVQYNYDFLDGDEMDVNSSYMTEINGSFVYLFNYRAYTEGYYGIYIQNDIDADIREVKLIDKQLLKKLLIQVKEVVDSEVRTMEKIINFAKSVGSINNDL